MTDVRAATAADLPVAVPTCANAFADDPMMNFLMGEPSQPEQRLRSFFEATLRIELAKDQHLTQMVEGGGAVALWHDVDEWKTPLPTLVRTALSSVRTFRGGLPRAVRVLGTMEKVHPTEPHLYLAIIGVRADQQGKGLGSALMAEMTARCDEQGLPAYLENSKPKNDAFYGRFGFESRGEIALPKGAPRLLAMWREPRG